MAEASIVAQPPWQDTAALNTLRANGTPPKFRINDPGQAQSIVSYLIEANRERARKQTQIKGMFDGNAPYNAWRLKAAGRAWEANFNSREGKARKSAAKVPYYDLFSGSKTYMEVETALGNPGEQAAWSAIITEEADRVLKDWIGFDFSVWTMLDDFIGYGKGFLFNQDPYSWRWKKVSQDRVLVHDGVDCDIEDGLEMLVVRQKFYAHQLWRYVKDTDRAKTLGWDRDAVLEAIRTAQPDTETDPWDDPVIIQQRLKDCDLYVTSRPARVNTARIYVREFDGSVSEMIVLEYGYSGKKETAPAWLYKKYGRYQDFSEVLTPFFFEMEDGSWHGCSGLGQDIYPQMQTKDRLNCQGINSAMMRGALILQAKTPAALKNVGLQMIGNSIVVPPDVNVQSSQVLGDIESVLAVSDKISEGVDENTGVYRPRTEKPSGNPEPLGVTQMRFAQSNTLSSSAVNRFLMQLDRGYQELYRRLSRAEQSGNDKAAEAARYFRKCCLDRGVPPEALTETRSVRASRTIGNGSVVMRQQSLGAIGSIMTRLPEAGQSAFMDDLIASYTTFDKVSRYNPKPEAGTQPDDQHEFALLENAAMRTGESPVVTGTQNNMIHAQVHLQSAAQAALSLQQGADTGQVYNYLERQGPHIKTHLDKLAQDPTRKGAVKVLLKQWQQLASLSDQLGQKLREQAQNRARTRRMASGMDPETEMKSMELRAKMRNAEMKTRHQMMLRQEQAGQKMQLAAAEAGQHMALADASTAADIRRKRAAAFQSNGQ